MPNRILRESMLDSERYRSLKTEAERLLFVELLLLVDDYGIGPANFGYLQRRTTVCLGKSSSHVDSLLSDLADADLVRVYLDNSNRYLFIPRFRNSPRSAKPKWPLPPDKDSQAEIQEYMELRKKRIATVRKRIATDIIRNETDTRISNTETSTGSVNTETGTGSGTGSGTEPVPEPEGFTGCFIYQPSLKGESVAHARAHAPAREAESSKKKRSLKTSMPESFAISDRVRQWAEKNRFENLEDHLEAFKRKAQMHNYRYVDWDAAFMEAIRQDWANLRGTNRAPPGKGKTARQMIEEMNLPEVPNDP